MGNQFAIVLDLPWYPTFLPGFEINLVFTLGFAVAMGMLIAPYLQMRRWAAVVWLICLLAPLAYTLTATASGGLTGCDITGLPWDSRSALFAPNTRMNVVMMIPAGAALLLLPRGAFRLAGLGISLALPIAIEFTQMAPFLRRGCQFADVVTNQAGVLIGWCLAAGLVTAWQSWRVAEGRCQTNNTMSMTTAGAVNRPE